MPFWWRRRKRNWYGNWYRYWRKRRPQKRRRRRRRPRRRRYTTRLNRRRRRRHYKVRRKKKKIPISQWQPDSIRKCKIIGLGTLVLGAEGTQMYCYTTEKDKYVPPKYPYGGGFGVEIFTLRYLYEQYCMHNNIWTTSNDFKDLLTYHGCKITFFRHPETDFIVSYTRTIGEGITKYTFPAVHPHQQFLNKRHKVIFSTATKPNGKPTVKIFIKPPNQMLTKWFFTKNFTKYPLFTLRGAAVNLRYSYLSNKNQNQLVNIYAINPDFYMHTNWDQAFTDPSFYVPYTNVKTNLEYIIKTTTGTTIKKTLNINKQNALSITDGWFNSQFLKAINIPVQGTHAATTPLLLGRYNPTIDDGTGNQIYLVSTVADSWQPPSKDLNLFLTGMPLWLGIYGFFSFINTIKPAPEFLKTHLLVLHSDAIHCWPQIGGCKKYAPLDWDYIQGKKTWEQDILDSDKLQWAPNCTWQMKTLNAIVESGPFIPQYADQLNSTWELKYKYKFYFKWGGPQNHEPDVKDPNDLPTFDVPDTINQRIQIRNPETQGTETILHPWDFRRGFVTETAIKRMYEHLPPDSEIEFITEPPQKKKRKGAAYQDPEEENQEIQSYLQTLCKENTLPEQETDLQHLIHLQQQQQQQVKYSIFKLLLDLRDKQKMLQLQTGLLD
nr:MAG: ORF1 [Torque teno midi virus]